MQSLMTLLLDSYVYLMTPLLNLVFKNMQNMNLLLVLFLCIFFVFILSLKLLSASSTSYSIRTLLSNLRINIAPLLCAG